MAPEMQSSPQDLRTRARGRKRAWRRRDSIAAPLLFLATAATILWQNAHVAVLWDFSYVLDSAARMAGGQMPYRDFPFSHAPLTFLIQAAILRLTGRVFFHHVLYAAIAGGLSTVLAWRIALDTLRGRTGAAWAIALLLAAPLAVLGIYCILPLPNYDCDCAISILVAIWLLRRLDAKPGLWLGLLTGAAVCVPAFFKQNMGLPFWASVLCVATWVLAMRLLRRGESDGTARAIFSLLAVLAGVVAALGAVALVLHFTSGIRTYLHWTIQFAAERRLPGAGAMLSVYRDPNLLWTLPCVIAALVLLRIRAGASRWAKLAALLLLAAPFLFTLASLFLYDDADERGDSLLALWPLVLILAAALALVRLVESGRGADRRGSGRRADLRALMPLLLLAAIHGAFLSQQLWGSTYSIWPLLILLLAEMIAFLAGLGPAGLREQGSLLAPFAAALVSITLLVCGGFYTASEERLSYAQFPEGPVMHSAFPQLAGMSTPGPFLPELDEMLRYAESNIPQNDGLILIPGEDPFYFVTGRVPRFPVLLFDPATDPYSPEEIAQMARTRGIRWLIVKRDLEIIGNPMPDRDATLKLLLEDFTPAAHLHGYDVYRR
jgi:hypothetical protein